MHRTTRRQPRYARRPRAALCALLSWLLLLATPAGAQTPTSDPILIEGSEQLAFDRPESWAMKYFTTVSMMSGMSPEEPAEPGSFSLSIEGGYVPSLGEDKRRVGFVGSKVEDLNRTHLFGRLRAIVGLPRGFALELGLTPWVEVDGVTPKLLSLAGSRTVLDRQSWSLGLRLHGQLGSIEGDLTCPAAVVGLEDPARNPDQCLEPSNDEAVQNYVGLELSAVRRRSGSPWSPYVAASLNYLDLEFRVDARYSVFVDRVRLLTDGSTFYLAAGSGYRLGERTALAGEIFYAPLSVRRPSRTEARNDALLNARFLLRYRLR